MRYGPLTDRTEGYGRAIRSIRRIRICVCVRVCVRQNLKLLWYYFFQELEIDRVMLYITEIIHMFCVVIFVQLQNVV